MWSFFFSPPEVNGGVFVKFTVAEYEAFVRTLAPRLDYRVLDGVGHFLMLQKPDDFNALLSQFLSALPKGEISKAK